jgi:hypothetical protein
MLSKKLFPSAIMLSVLIVSACGINTVTREELDSVKPGNVLTYRYRESDNREWFYADKITRVDGDTVYYNASKKRSTKGSDSGIKDFDTTQELSMKKEELLKFATEQGDDKKKVIWIE